MFLSKGKTKIEDKLGNRMRSHGILENETIYLVGNKGFCVFFLYLFLIVLEKHVFVSSLFSNTEDSTL
jgi:hypothetical protein